MGIAKIGPSISIRIVSCVNATGIVLFVAWFGAVAFVVTLVIAVAFKQVMGQKLRRLRLRLRLQLRLQLRLRIRLRTLRRFCLRSIFNNARRET